MSFFKKMLATVGIGAAKVDTVLNSSVFYPGGQVEGVINVTGGSVDQEIDELTLSLMVEVKRESDDTTYYEHQSIQKYHVANNFKIKSGESIQLPFNFTLPFELPISAVGARKLGNVKVFIKTDLDIDDALDKADYDYLQIQPLPAMKTVLDTLDSMGFTFFKSDVEYGHIQESNYSFFQEIEYKAGNSPYSRKISELELTFIGKNDGVMLILEIDKKGFFGGDTYRRLFIPYQDQGFNHRAELDRVITSI